MQSSKPEPFTLPTVQAITLRSDVNGRNYALRIGLPPSYCVGDSRYPILFVLDAEFTFGTAYDAATLEAMWSRRARAPSGTKTIPEVIVVGLSLPDTSDDPFRRNYEFMPEVAPESLHEATRQFQAELLRQSGHPIRFGGAPDLLKIVRQEILPLIDENYRTDRSRRILMGQSAGGTFACYTLFTKPDSFTDYLIVSPGLLGDDMFEREAAWTHENRELKARVFLSAGEAEIEDPLQIFSQTARLAQLLRWRRYPSLTLHTWFIPGATHVQTAAPSISRGLVALLG